MDFIVFSHLRWDFVFQRPQHLLGRCSRDNRVFFWEEPTLSESGRVSLRISTREPGVTLVVPELPAGLSQEEGWEVQRELLGKFISDYQIDEFVAWYYSPMAVHFTEAISPAVTVYDCMDELSAFRGAPPGLRQAELQLFEIADLVFTGGQSLYNSKRTQHSSVHLFPSSIDFEHFAQARQISLEPADQAWIPHPRFGYCGVIDERMDTELLADVADLHREWQLVMVGPVVKISEEDLPKRRNIHYLGGKTYQELPSYMAGWDAAIMPFALNESTRFISPTKTPEYLAAGKQVVSTPITDVISPYGSLGLVAIAATSREFASALEQTLVSRSSQEEQIRLRLVDSFLARSSWDTTWKRMKELILEESRQRTSTAPSGLDIATGQNAVSAD